ncbi:MAG: DNA gyrase/topoisomerase IV subunit A, partial [Bacteroidota bacterium]|nr:DNA gyrase/topoisomerase IV subunit A [Bacteroidota bacterium]
HNFNELIDASISYLQGKPFELYPDFPTGGMIDVSKYNDGARGGAVKVRARIEKVDRKGLVITEIPFGKTTSSLIESIVKANDRGKIKIKKIDDNTAGGVEIVIQLQSGISPDKTIDALYAFTDCELSISPNACVITDENKPAFIGVSDILRHSADQTVKLLTRELEIRKAELEEEWHFSSLEKIFIEKRIYRDIEECETWEAVIAAIDKGLKPYKKLFKREITRDDIIKLTEIKIKRISKYDSSRADEHIRGLEAELEEVANHLANIIPYAINYYRQIKKKYGKDRDRRTEIRSFETIEATKVVAANAKLYVNRQEGFIGTGLKKDEFVCDCSDIDDIIVIRKDGTYLITKVAEKQFVGKDVIHVQVFLRNDTRTIYNVAYQDGREGPYYVKRCALTGLTRDKEYNLGRGTAGTRILYLSANPNGEAEVIRVYHKPKARLKKLTFDFDFGELAIKGRSSMGNILTKNPVHKITLKEKGLSTLGGRKLWFDDAVMRLNADGRGKFLGEFASEEVLLVVTRSGWYRTSGTDLSSHFEDDLLLLEKFRESKIFSAVYWDQEQEFYYVKRFAFEEADRLQCFISDSEGSRLVSLTEVEYPRFELKFGGKNEGRKQEIIEVAEFIGVKSFRAKGRRLSNYSVADIRELEPVVRSEAAPQQPEPEDGSEEDFPPQLHTPDDPAQMKLDL